MTRNATPGVSTAATHASASDTTRRWHWHLPVAASVRVRVRIQELPIRHWHCDWHSGQLAKDSESLTGTGSEGPA